MENGDGMMGLRQKIHEEKFLIKIVEAAAIVGIMVLLSLLFDYRYAMNDDVLVNAIISGKYSGSPDFHNISIATPLNALFFVCKCPVVWYWDDNMSVLVHLFYYYHSEQKNGYGKGLDVDIYSDSKYSADWDHDK